MVWDMSFYVIIFKKKKTDFQTILKFMLNLTPNKKAQDVRIHENMYKNELRIFLCVLVLF